jgi:hypothetical protein
MHNPGEQDGTGMPLPPSPTYTDQPSIPDVLSLTFPTHPFSPALHPPAGSLPPSLPSTPPSLYSFLPPLSLSHVCVLGVAPVRTLGRSGCSGNAFNLDSDNRACVFADISAPKSVLELVKFSKDPTCYKKYVYDMYQRTHPLYCHISYYGEIVKDRRAASGPQWDAVVIPDCPSGRIWAQTRAQSEHQQNLFTRAAGIADIATFDVRALDGSLTMID